MAITHKVQLAKDRDSWKKMTHQNLTQKMARE